MLRRLIVVLAFSLAVLAASGQVTVPPQKTSPKLQKVPGNCTVSGRVVSAAEGTPLRSARVALVEANVHKHPQVYATVTDNDGRFEIKQIEAGRYEFFASKIGYLERHYQSKIADDEGATLSVTAGQVVDDAIFRLIRAGVITGKVVDDTGEPMMNVNVSVLRKPTEEEREREGQHGRHVELTSVSNGSTDDRGTYRIFGLKPGDYYVKATEGGGLMFMSGGGGDETVLQELGSQFAPIYYPGVLRVDQAQTLSLSVGEEVQADFALQKQKVVEVAGRVIGADGAPAVRTYVQMMQVGVDDWSSQLGASADSSGEFSIKGVAPGTYYIRAFARDKDKSYSARTKIEVGDAKIDGVILNLGGGATIHGRVRTSSGAAFPMGRMFVGLESATGEEETGSFYNEVGKDGSFQVNNLVDGGYAVNVANVEQGWFVKSVHFGGDDALQNGVQVEGGAVKGTLEIVLSNDGGQIEGTVTSVDKSEPLAGVQVKARVDPENDYNRGRSKQTTTDQNGHFLVKDVPPGKYKVTAKMPKPASDGQDVKSDAVGVTLNERDHRVVDFKLTLPKSEQTE